MAINGPGIGESAGFRPPSARHWRSYGTEALPTAAEALAESAFPSWFLRIECDRCGKVVMHNARTGSLSG